MDGQIVGFSATSLMFRQLHAKKKAICCGLSPWQMAFFYRMNLPKRFVRSKTNYLPVHASVPSVRRTLKPAPLLI